MLKGPYLQDLAPTSITVMWQLDELAPAQADRRRTGWRARAGRRGARIAEARIDGPRAVEPLSLSRRGRRRDLARRVRDRAAGRQGRAVLVRRGRRLAQRHRAASPRRRADVARGPRLRARHRRHGRRRRRARISGSSSSTSRTSCCATTSTSRRSATTIARAAAAPRIRTARTSRSPRTAATPSATTRSRYASVAVPRARLQRVQLRAHRSDVVDRARADRGAPGPGDPPRLRRDAPPAVLDLAARRRSATCASAGRRCSRSTRSPRCSPATTTSTSAPSTTACTTS